MKLSAMKCPNCGASVEVFEEGAVKCKYCCQVLYAESEKAPAVHNTIINNYNYKEETREFNSKFDEEGNKLYNKLLAIAVFGIIFVIVMVVITSQIPSYEIVDEDLQSNIHFDTLMDITASEYEVSDEVGDISDLRFMVNLKTLNIPDASNITDYSVLYNMPSIENLTIRNAEELEDIGFLSSLVNLQYLNIEGSRIDDLSILEDNLSITELVLENNEELSDYTFLDNLPSLKKLKLTTTQGALIPDFSQHKFLTDININGETK